MMNVKSSPGIRIGLIILMGALIQGSILFIHRDNGIQDSDAAVTGLMAKHIYEGTDFPLMWYGQGYGGTLDCYLIAGLMSLFGLSATTVRLFSVIFSLIFILLVYTLAAEMFGTKVGLVSGLWMTIAPPYFAIFSLNKGVYTQMIVFGISLLLIAYRLCYNPGTVQRVRIHLSIFGLIAGLGLWSQPLILPSLATAMVFLLLRGRRCLSRSNMLLGVVSFLIGVSPLIVYNLSSAGQNLIYARGILSHSGQSFWNIPSRAYNYLFVVLPILLGGAPLWSFERVELSWRFPLYLNKLILFAAFMTVLMALCGGWWYWMRRGKVVKSFSPKVKFLFGLLPLVIMFVMISISIYFRRNLVEMIQAIRTSGLTWSLFPGGGLYSPGFVMGEVLNKAMLIYLLYLPAFGYIMYKRSKRQIHKGIDILLSFFVIASGCYLFSSYGESRAPRYLMPLYAVIPIVLAFFICDLKQYSQRLSQGLMLTFLVIHITGLLNIPPYLYCQSTGFLRWYIMEDPRFIPISNQTIIDFLLDHRIFHVYTKYSLGMPVIFDSREKIVTSSGASGRYPNYDQAVAQSERVAYLFHGNSPENKAFETMLAQEHVQYQKVTISYANIYYDVELGKRLSSPLWPFIVQCLNAL